VDVSEQTFATGGDIKAWAEKSFFGGARTYEFSRGGTDLVIVNGMPTSGMVTSHVMVYGRAQGEPTFRPLLTTSVIYARIQAKENALGVVLSVDDKVVLIVPFELATFKSKPIRLFERPR
jgi:hypothetical protein